MSCTSTTLPVEFLSFHLIQFTRDVGHCPLDARDDYYTEEHCTKEGHATHTPVTNSHTFEVLSQPGLSQTHHAMTNVQHDAVCTVSRIGRGLLEAYTLHIREAVSRSTDMKGHSYLGSTNTPSQHPHITLTLAPFAAPSH